MFDIGFLELAIILVLSLLVLGPERLPKAARSVGYWFGKARRYVEGMKSQVEAEFDSTEVKRLLRNQEVQIRELQSKIKNGTDVDQYIDENYHNQFENKDDPGEYEAGIEQSAESQKPAGRQYEMIEEDDERWDELPEDNNAASSATPDESLHDESLKDGLLQQESLQEEPQQVVADNSPLAKELSSSRSKPS